MAGYEEISISRVEDWWAIPTHYQEQAATVYNNYKRYNKHPLAAAVCEELLKWQVRSRYAEVVAKAFELADIERKGFLDIETFTVAYYLVFIYGHDGLPATLPFKLIPLSMRYSKHEVLSTETPSNQIVTSQESLILTAFSPFAHEIWGIVFGFLSQITLLDVCRVSKSFHDIGIPILYRSVKLSTCTSAKTPYEFNSTDYRDISIHTRVQQYRFANQLLRTPDYGRFVQNFLWSNELESKPRMSYPTFIDDKLFQWHDHQLSEMFACLQNVNYIDIDTCALFTAAPDIMACFPSARIILLRGGMPLPLLYEILHGEHAPQLKRLILGNIFERYQPVEDSMEEKRKMWQQPENTESVEDTVQQWTFEFELPSRKHFTLPILSTISRHIKKRGTISMRTLEKPTTEQSTM